MPAPLPPLVIELTRLHALIHQPPLDRDALSATFLQAHQRFKVQILPWAAAWPAAQPILTEMTRTFRLAGLEVGRLQIARQPSSTAQYQQKLTHSVQQLQGFCQALAKATTEASPATTNPSQTRPNNPGPDNLTP